MSLADHARRYAEMRWALVELNGKNPIGYGWQKASPLPSKEAEVLWAGRECNMGVVLGPSGLIDFELDGGDRDLYWELAGVAGENTPHFVTGSGKPHLLFWDKDGLSRRTREGLELRAGPHQSVIPPSVHPDTGRPYEWVRAPWDFTPQNPPQKLLDFFSERNGGRNEGNWREALRGQRLGKGQGRHQSLVSYMGLAVNQFEDFDTFLAASITFAQLTQDPPYSDGEIEKWAGRIWDSYRDAPETAEAAKEYLHVKRGSEIRPRSVSFIWKPFLQTSAFHLWVGPKGVGKGSTLAWAAAQMTQGQLDDGTPRSVMWISTEDSFDIDVIPRVRAQGGDVDMILCVHQVVRLPSDIPAIKATCEAENVGMVIIDPIVGTTGGIDSNDEGSVVAAIGGLNKLADDLGICIVGVRHQGKGTERSGLERVLGSVAWVNTPRAVIGISQDDGNHFERAVKLELLAGNRTQRGATTEFYLGDKIVPGLATPVSFVTPK